MPVTSARTGFSLAAPVAAVVAFSSCAIPPTQSGPAPRSSSVLSETQIANTYAATAYEVVARLRPTALRVTGGKIFEPTVYLDGLRMGGLGELRRIPAIGLTQIRFLSASEAFGLYGADQRNGGAIVLITKPVGMVKLDPRTR
jgi:hypothetical protein